MNISDAARLTESSPRMLRYYESEGLIHPGRTVSGYRDYRRADIEQIRRIRRLIEAGLSTETIAKVVPCLERGADEMVPVCPETVALLRHEEKRISSAIASLQEAQETLHSIVERA